MTLHSRRSRLTVIGMATLALVGSPLALTPAAGVTACTTLTPSLGETVTCTGAGTVDIVAPAGAMSAVVRATGGGGAAGSGGGGFNGGSGGAGAVLDSTIDVSSLTGLHVVIGAGGLGSAGRGGEGGGFTAVYPYASVTASEVLLVSGGGGGGGGYFTCNNGYDGGPGGGFAGYDGMGASGGAGALGNGGGGSGVPGGSSEASGATWAAGGIGLASSNPHGGGGGSGYGAGQAGGTRSGGGAGGSFALGSRASATTVVAASSGFGVGTTASPGADGSDGSIIITFSGSAVSALPEPPAAPSWVLTFDRGDGTQTQTSAFDTTWLTTPTAAQVQRPGRTLLGWATDAAFPVEMAKSATSAYDGMIRDRRIIFVPQGHPIHVSGANTLYAVWSTDAPLVRC